MSNDTTGRIFVTLDGVQHEVRRVEHVRRWPDGLIERSELVSTAARVPIETQLRDALNRIWGDDDGRLCALLKPVSVNQRRILQDLFNRKARSDRSAVQLPEADAKSIQRLRRSELGRALVVTVRGARGGHHLTTLGLRLLNQDRL